eukprot:CAMPEP_0113579478 /NCGR_PEP_ID=MMETSP0015_2-20120614/30093_1 /TAXON_ID=2838 /ORGANISM="Odontella" /LENGTH=156 /DNA_ID=CAMNT_0000483467 /DNA_START=8 /DNA_END=475 /DNA_ORIENTATION=- /assembly_acc=CAM_ASM_000160
MEEFRAWVRQSRVEDDGAKNGAVAKQRAEGRDCPDVTRSSDNSRPTDNAATSCLDMNGDANDPTLPSYFKSKSVLALMMETGVEIVHFGAGGHVHEEAAYCLCANRSTGTITVVFLGAITMMSCLSRSMGEYSDPTISLVCSTSTQDKVEDGGKDG